MTFDSVVPSFLNLPPVCKENGRTGPWHGVQLYANETFLSESVGRFLGDGLLAGESAIVVATPGHVEQFNSRLEALGLDVAKLTLGRQYVTLDAADLLSKFLVNGWPDASLFEGTIGTLIRRSAAARPGYRIRVFGEMVWLLWETEQQAAVLRLEELWNRLLQAHPFDLFCAYPMGAFRSKVSADAFLKICAEHSHVLPSSW
jgi:hypothetical protein